jgi:prepilin-type N-terminal cleavage/methylation domain-containing protein
MLKKSSNSQKGFTIIEVLIVLAIAGLILLIVFLAVPALQRNSRNTQRKNDVSAILSGMSEYINNNSGSLPGSFSSNGASTLVIRSGTSGSGTEVKLGYYGASQNITNGVTINSGTGTVTNATSAENVIIVTRAKCSGSDAVTGPSRGFVALYSVESGSSTTKVCQEG